MIDKLIISEAVSRIGTFTITFLIISHIITCFFIFIGYSDSGFNWMIYYGIRDESVGEIYVASLYFNWTTIFTTGYGDIIPVNTPERIYVICLMTVGLVVYSFSISALGAVLTSKDDQTKSYMKGIQLLDDFRMKYNNEIPDETYNRCLKYLTYNYDLNKDSTMKLIDEFPKKLKMNILYSINGRIIKLFQFFNIRNQDMIGVILDKIKPMRVFKDEDLLYENELVEEIIFVENGVLSQIITVDKLEIKVAELRRRYYFGAIFCITGQLSPIGIKVCSRFADLFILSKYDIDFKNDELIADIIENAKDSHFGLLELIELKKFHLEEKKKRYHGTLENPYDDSGDEDESGSGSRSNEEKSEDNEREDIEHEDREREVEHNNRIQPEGSPASRGNIKSNIENLSSKNTQLELDNISEKSEDEDMNTSLINDKKSRGKSGYLDDNRMKESKRSVPPSRRTSAVVHDIYQDAEANEFKDYEYDSFTAAFSGPRSSLDILEFDKLRKKYKKRLMTPRCGMRLKKSQLDAYNKLSKNIEKIRLEELRTSNLLTERNAEGNILKQMYAGDEYINKEVNKRRIPTDPEEEPLSEHPKITFKKKNTWVVKAVKPKVTTGVTKLKSKRGIQVAKQQLKKRITSDLTDFETFSWKPKIKNSKDIGKLAKKQDNLLDFNDGLLSDEMQNIFLEQKKIEKLDHQNKRLDNLVNKFTKKFN